MQEKHVVFYDQITGDVTASATIIDNLVMPSGNWMEVPDSFESEDLRAWYVNENGTLTSQNVAATHEDIDRERDKRIVSNFYFMGVRFDFDEVAQQNIAGATTIASAAISNGALPGDLLWAGAGVDFVWFAADNTKIPMDAQTVFSFGSAGFKHKSDHIFAGRELKDSLNDVFDIGSDLHWPAVT